MRWTGLAGKIAEAFNDMVERTHDSHPSWSA